MSRPRLLDLYCKAGGASMGYHLAGLDVTGVDIEPQPRYPFAFVQADALEYVAAHGHEYDAIAASPPCHDHSDLAGRHGTNGTGWLLSATRQALTELGRPYVIENVGRAHMPGSLVLCGTEFGLSAITVEGRRRWLKRHRRFEANIPLWGAGGCTCARRLIGGVYGTGGGGKMTRGYKYGRKDGAAAMGIDWMTWPELAQAIPPAYTRFIGEQLFAWLADRDRPNATVDAGIRCAAGPDNMPASTYVSAVTS